jgi:hypothetical protein
MTGGVELVRVSFKKVIAATIGMVLSSQLAISSQASTVDLPYAPPPRSDAQVGSTFFEVAEMGGFHMGSSITAQARSNSFGSTNSRQCSESLDLPQCNPETLTDDSFLQARLVLPVCESPGQSNCMDAPVLIDAQGKRTTGILLKYQKALITPPHEKLGLPAGSTSTLWKFPGVENSSGTDTYVAAALVQYEVNKGTSQFVAKDLTLSLAPYVLETNPSFSGYVRRETQNSDGTWTAGLRSWDMEKPCIWLEDGACGLVANFSEGVTAEFAVNIPNTIAGWLEGRIKNPVAEITKLSPSQNRLQISAEPARVSRYLAKITKGQLPLAQEEAITKIKSGTGGGWFEGAALKHVFSSSLWALENTELLKGAVNDKAYGISTIWTVKSAYGQQRCLDDTSKVLGIVATNAMIYAGGPPKFTDGSLNYSVAGMHYQSDGSLATGTYDLLIRSDTARCLYGFTNAPVNASVQVISDRGEETVATTVASEKNGWIKLAAYGFTFSNKEIKVKISQPFTLNVSKFASLKMTLTSQQKAEVAAAVSRASENTSLTCTVLYATASKRNIAQLRSNAVCKYAKKLNSALTVLSVVKATTVKGLDGRIVLSSK